MRDLYLFLFFIGITLGVSGCSWFSFGNDVVEDGETYRKGVQAFEKKEYDKAIQQFREIPPDSPHYPKTLALIQKIPLQRAEDAIESEDYQMALSELNKIPQTNKSYSRAQQLKTEVTYQMAMDEYQKARRSPERIRALGKLSNMAAEGKNKDSLLGVIEMIGGQLNQATQAREVETLIHLLQETLEEQQDREVVVAGLEQTFEAYDQFNGDPRFRDRLLRLIAELKLKL